MVVGRLVAVAPAATCATQTHSNNTQPQAIHQKKSDLFFLFSSEFRDLRFKVGDMCGLKPLFKLKMHEGGVFSA